MNDAVSGTYQPRINTVPTNLSITGGTAANTELSNGFYLVAADIDFNIILGTTNATACNSDCWLIKADTIHPLLVRGKQFVVCNSASTGTVKFLKQPNE
jgi:hypothetical protein